MKGSAKTRSSASQTKKQKKSDVYFNQIVQPAYSTIGEQNDQYQSKMQYQQVLKKCLNLSCKPNQKKTNIGNIVHNSFNLRIKKSTIYLSGISKRNNWMYLNTIYK